MDAQYYLKQMKSIQQALIDYLDDESDFDTFYQLYLNLKEYLSTREMLFIVNLVINIANNYHRTPNFIDKILQIMGKIKNEIKQTLSNFEIFQLFKDNKRLLLYLIEESIFKVDQSFIKNIDENKYWDAQYIKYFLPEVKPFISNKFYDEIQEGLNFEQIDLEMFKKFRRIGENHQYICELIRNDSIDEFIIYMNKTNASFLSTLKHSIFETNSFLLNKNTSLIEYSAFFGSFQIFKYLQLNNVELKSSLWLYAIHGNNPEIIHILEENHVEPEDKSFKECFDEAIKCYCNDVASYILNNLIDVSQEKKFENYYLYYEYNNFYFFDEDFRNISQLYYLIRYHYDFLALNILKNDFEDINKNVISKIFFFLMTVLLISLFQRRYCIWLLKLGI